MTWEIKAYTSLLQNIFTAWLVESVNEEPGLHAGCAYCVHAIGFLILAMCYVLYGFVICVFRFLLS
jgi:hypothetical protein